MRPSKLHKVLSIAIFMYSFGMAFALLFYGKFCLEVLLIAFGYFGLIFPWLWGLVREVEGAL